ncbi:MAG TPA: phosphoenolpyruvate carboxykinase domain-containing protein, partial [bacterium]|nr:phosphoenolpyruvate carboxykinase domain-containing protein [bacterium]
SLKTGDFLNSRKDKHVWVKWMELRIHNDVKAIETPTGFIPIYEDLKILFNDVLKKEYSKEDYIEQFTIRVLENLMKIERVLKFCREKIEEAPDEVFEVLNQQKERLIKAREKFGDYISPERFI